MALNIELKGSDCAAATFAALTAFASDSTGTLDPYTISSFDHRQLFEVKQKLPGAKRGVLTAGIPLDYAACCEAIGAYSFHPSLDCISAGLVDDMLLWNSLLATFVMLTCARILAVLLLLAGTI